MRYFMSGVDQLFWGKGGKNVGICIKYKKINIYKIEYVRAKFLSAGIASSNLQMIILKIWDLMLIDIWYQ